MAALLNQIFMQIGTVYCIAYRERIFVAYLPAPLQSKFTLHTALSAHTTKFMLTDSLAELGTRQLCRDNVTIFSGQQN